jgi:asparagine synthase (glutamine-hydrolysing)
MSGIAGIYVLDDRAVDCSDLQRMVERLAHRGSDGSGVWSDNAVGLGHRMLWTTPESLDEKFPLVNRAGDLALTADARIDNRDELIAALGLCRPSEPGIGDGELILRAYERWGERCPEKLVGDFAFAIWDRRAQILFCARDHFGVKPFYYYRSPRIFAFASEIKALLCLPEVPRRLNETRVADYLVPMFEDKEITFYQDIFRSPPAHTMMVGREGVSLRAYWALDPSRELRLGSDEEYAEAFREVFTEAVRCRLRSAYPVGSMLSGGLDSSSIVCAARSLLSQEGSRRLRTFSAIFDDIPECDDRPFINAVLARGEVEPHYLRADRLSPLTDLDRVFYHEDEPFYAPNLYIHWGLYKAAREQKVPVLLDGLDGDTTVSHGITFLIELARTGRWMTLAREVDGLARRFDVSPSVVFWRHVLKPLAPEPARRLRRWLRARNGRGRTAHSIISPDFARRIGAAERIEVLERNWARSAPTVREDHWRRLTWGLLPFFLEVADRAASAFFIEPRYPFFDRRLVEFCLGLPAEQKLRGGWTRMVLRRAMAHVLPDEIRWRGGKSDLSASFNRGLLAFCRKQLNEVILDDPKLIEPYVDVAALREAYRRYVAKGTADDALSVWKAATLALWLQRTRLTPLVNMNQP